MTALSFAILVGVCVWSVDGAHQIVQRTDSCAPSGYSAPFRDICSKCCWWAQQGECHQNAEFMRPYCQESCGTYYCQPERAHSCQVFVSARCQQGSAQPPTQTQYRRLTNGQYVIDNGRRTNNRHIVIDLHLRPSDYYTATTPKPSYPFPYSWPPWTGNNNNNNNNNNQLTNFYSQQLLQRLIGGQPVGIGSPGTFGPTITTKESDRYLTGLGSIQARSQGPIYIPFGQMKKGAAAKL